MFMTMAFIWGWAIRGFLSNRTTTFDKMVKGTDIVISQGQKLEFLFPPPPPPTSKQLKKSNDNCEKIKDVEL